MSRRSDHGARVRPQVPRWLKNVVLPAPFGPDDGRDLPARHAERHAAHAWGSIERLCRRTLDSSMAGAETRAAPLSSAPTMPPGEGERSR